MAAERGLVLDANILIRLVLGAKVRDLVLAYLGDVVFFSPVECFDDARKYLPDLLSRRGMDPAPALEVDEGWTPRRRLRWTRDGPRAGA